MAGRQLQQRLGPVVGELSIEKWQKVESGFDSFVRSPKVNPIRAVDRNRFPP